MSKTYAWWSTSIIEHYPPATAPTPAEVGVSVKKKKIDPQKNALPTS
jgi:hypothetical protein